MTSGFAPLLFAVREENLDVVSQLDPAEGRADVNETVPVSGRRRGYGGPAPGGQDQQIY